MTLDVAALAPSAWTGVTAFLPSPSQGVWNVGPLPIRAYALAILVGIVLAIVVGAARWEERGGQRSEVYDIAVWAVPFGIVGARIYHVATDWETYFGPSGKGLGAALQIWQGGLGIWGAISFGALGAWIGARRAGVLMPPFADAIAPGIVLAQAVGRWGNWFNQELFGAPSTLPWAVQIDPVHRPAGYEQFETFHPTFLYESLWCLAVAGVVVWADRRFRMGHGRVFALYVALYCVGRVWWESLRIDDARYVLGLRFNVFTAVLVGLGAVIYLVVSARRRPGREASVYRADAPGREGHGDDVPPSPQADDAARDGADEPAVDSATDEPAVDDATQVEPAQVDAGAPDIGSSSSASPAPRNDR